jgi:uncharacterized protein YndB with AHSA1/START domain
MATLTTKPSLTIKRRFKVAPSKVFAAWTDPEKVKHWMGPGEVKVLRVESDPRTGGRFRWVMQAPSGEEHDVSGVYREVIPNEKLVFTWAWKTTPERESLVTVTFKSDGDGTLMTLTHEQFFDEAARDRHQGGWQAAVEKMEAYLASQ